MFIIISKSIISIVIVLGGAQWSVAYQEISDWEKSFVHDKHSSLLVASISDRWIEGCIAFIYGANVIMENVRHVVVPIVIKRIP